MKTFNMATGPVEHTTSEERTYLLKFIREGITFVAHLENHKLVISEWTTGHRLTTLHDLDPEEIFGLDILVEAEADALLAKHGLEKFHRYIAMRKVIN